MTDSRDFPYMCPTCGSSKRFLTLVGLWSHLENKHPHHPKYADTSDPNNLETLSSIEQRPFTSLDNYSSAHALELERQLKRAREKDLQNELLQAETRSGLYNGTSTAPLSPITYRKDNKIHAAELEPKSISTVLNPKTNTEADYQKQDSSVWLEYAQKSLPHYAPSTLGTPQHFPISNYASLLNKDSFPINGYPASTAALLDKFHVKDQLDKLKDYDNLSFTVDKLTEELRIKETKLDRANMELEKLALDRRKLQRETLELSKENDSNSEYVGLLKKHLIDKDRLIVDKEKEVVNLTEFLKSTAEKEASARTQLESFINNLIRRAERAETRLYLLQSQPHLASSFRHEPLTVHIKQPVQDEKSDDDPYVHDIHSESDFREIEEQIISPVNAKDDNHVGNSFPRDNPDRKYFSIPFSSADSGFGESGPSSAKTVNSQIPTNNSVSAIPCIEDMSIEQQESILEQKLSEIRVKQHDNSLRRLPKKYEYPTEPPVDYSTDSITTVTEDTEPDDPEFINSIQKRKTRGKRKSVRNQKRQIPGSRNIGKKQLQNGEVKRRHDALFCVFMYLDNVTLGYCSMVCKDWRDVSRHPALWRNVRLGKARMSSKYLMFISKWCTEVHSLTLMGLKGRPKRDTETNEDYSSLTRASLETGLEWILKASCNTLTTLKIVDCRNLLTQRSLWIASGTCPKLQQLVYVSDMYPIGTEVLWSLGAGCPEIRTLIIPPIQPNERPMALNDNCCELIGRCWPNLNILCIGGQGISEKGLVAIAKNCLRIQVLELDHIFEIKEATAAVMCAAGLKGLEVLDFTFTPVTPKALVQFVSACPKLNSISVHVGISDYYKDKDNPENKTEFKQIVHRLKDLQQRQGFNNILQVETDYG